MRDRPVFSVVVPTRDRPAFVAWCLEALARQTWSDFEVIVYDNHTTRPCKAEFDRFADDRFRYLTPPRPLGMSDNWESAHLEASGEYVLTLTDKSALVPVALERAAASIEDTPDIVNWWSDGYDLVDEEAGLAVGLYRPYFAAVAPTSFDPRAVLRDRMEFRERRGSEGVRYYWGKICFGAFHRSLISRIRGTMGRLFPPINPDYTSATAALWLAQKAVDVGEPLQLSFNSTTSNGRRMAIDADHARKYLMDCDRTGQLFDMLPIPGLYTSVHNLVGHDYDSTLQLLTPSAGLTVNRPNLAARAVEDLAAVTWTDPDERHAQYALFDEWCRATGGDTPRRAAEALRSLHRRAPVERGRAAFRHLQARLPGPAAALARLAGGSRAPALPCESIIDATQRATDRYAALRGA